MTTDPSRALALFVRLHDDRYHGTPEWPPAPARLFQALVAGCGPRLEHEAMAALRFLEQLPPPTIAAPLPTTGENVVVYVPNNDLDTKGGDPAELAAVRTAKRIQPRLVDRQVPFVYAWPLPTGEEALAHARAVCALAERLYQFGRGVDMAFAHGEVLDAPRLDAMLDAHPGQVFRPVPGASAPERRLAAPAPGSLDSLEVRYRAASERLQVVGRGSRAKQVFSQPPKARFGQVGYDCPPTRALFELRPPDLVGRLGCWPLARISPATVAIRDAAALRLMTALPMRQDDVERTLIGRPVADRTTPVELRVRIIPLASIGHEHVDFGVRRVLVEVPQGGPLAEDDVFWAFSGLEVPAPDGDGKLVLTRADDDGMLRHYGVGSGRAARVWRTVTAAALPDVAARRRIAPTRVQEEAKPGTERAEEERRATLAVAQALRHAGVRARVDAIRVQREPFGRHGERAEAFAEGTRFAKEQLWHIEVAFAEPVAGPLVIGNGRFLGLGLMAPAPGLSADQVLAFEVTDGLREGAQPGGLAQALRRAVMARVQDRLGPRAELPAYFSGHGEDGAPAGADAPHLSFAFDAERRRLLVVAPSARDRRPPWAEREHLRVLSEALADFTELRAGAGGRLSLRPWTLDLQRDPLFAPAKTWVSATPYVVNRHAKGASAHEAVSADLRAACLRAGLPEPRVTVLQAQGVAGVGLSGHARLEFAVAVEGPLLLGRTRHKGGGLFVGECAASGEPG